MLDYVLLIATISLVIQLLVLGLLGIGFSYKRKLKYRLHGAIMSAAVIIHAFSILLIMIPSFLAVTSPNFALPEPHQLVYAAGVIHATAGILAFALGIWLMVAWRFGQNVQGCIKRKKFMFVTLALWVTAVVLGIILYFVFYAPFISS